MNEDGSAFRFDKSAQGRLMRLALLGLLASAFGFEHATESLSERRSRIEHLDAEQKEQLWRQYERFRALPPAEQVRLRSLNEKLSQDAEAAQLQQVMERFQAWLDRLSSAERAELISLDPQQRLQRIEQLRKEEARQLGPEDIKAFAGWLEARLLKQFPRERANFAALSETERRERVRSLMRVQFSQPNFRQRPLFSKEDFAELHKALSPKAQQQLDEAAAPMERRALFGSWIRQVYSQGPAGPSLRMTGIGEERLRKFFNDELDVSERVELLRLPSDQMQRQLRRMYQQRRPAPKGKRPPGPAAKQFRGRPPALSGGESEQKPREKPPRLNPPSG
ncbi:MAG TPA: hypothetical protein VHC19_06350 [Pirellulales bacterium]|nr:hypothetical protein [Pirellulales bacterium]